MKDQKITPLQKFRFAMKFLSEKKDIKQKVIADKLNYSPSLVSQIMTKKSSYVPKMKVDAMMGIIEKEYGLLDEFKTKLPDYIKEETVQNSEFPEDYEYDIFLASPKLTLEKKAIRYQRLEMSIKELLNGFGIDSSTMLPDFHSYPELEDKLMKLIQKTYFGFELSNSIESELREFNEQVESLCEKLTKEGLRVHYSRENMTLQEAKTDFAPSVFKKDFNNLKKSRTYLIVSPYPRLFSSAWVELGMSMMMSETPIMMIVKNIDEDIPYILSQRTSLKKFYYGKIDSISAEFKFQMQHYFA